MEKIQTKMNQPQLTPMREALLVEFPKCLLTMVDLCNLDSAMCNRAYRPKFLEMMKVESAVFNGEIATSFGIEHDFISNPTVSSSDDSLLIGMDQTPSYLTRYGRTGHSQVPKTLATKRKFERKAKRDSMLEQRKDTCYYRQPYQKNDELILPNSIFCLPNYKSGAYYMRWLTLRHIIVKHLIVTLDFSDSASAQHFLYYFLADDDVEVKNPNKSLDDVDLEQYMSLHRNMGYGSETDDNYIAKGRRLDSMWDHFDTSNVATTPILELSFDSNCQMDTTVAYDTIRQVDQPITHQYKIGRKSKGYNQRNYTNRINRKLKSLCFRNCNALSDDDLFVVHPCSFVENLELLNCTKVSDSGIMTVTQSWKSLKSLNFRDSNRLSDDAVCAIAMNCPRLQFLDFHSCNKITDIGLHQVALSCKDLRYLYLSFGFSVTDEGFITIISSCDRLETLSLELCNKVTDEGLNILGSKVFPSMLNLNLWGCTRLTDDSLSLIGNACPNLTSLFMGLCVKLTDEAMTTIAMKCTQLQYININYCTRITDTSLLNIAQNCPKLKSLEVSMCKKVSNFGLQCIFRKCKELESLNLEGCKEVSDNFLLGSYPEVNSMAFDVLMAFEEGGLTSSIINNSNNNSNNIDNLNVDGNLDEMEQYNNTQDLDTVPIDIRRSPDSVGYLETSLDSNNEVTRINTAGITTTASSAFNNDSIMLDQSSFAGTEDPLRLHSFDALQPSSSADYQPFYSPTQSPINRGNAYNIFSSTSKVSQSNRKKQFPLLKSLLKLNISECPAITDLALAFLARNCPHLRVLNVRQCNLITRDGIINIKRNCHDIRILHSL